MYALATQAQVVVSYFPIQSTLSVASNTDKLLWGDFKMETNTLFSNINMELSPKVNFRRREVVCYYLGAGINFDPTYKYKNTPFVNGFFADFGARIKPFAQCRNLQLVFEVSPYVNKEMIGGNLRSRIGVAWAFTKKLQNNQTPKQDGDK
jgi:hypothetical protein